VETLAEKKKGRYRNETETNRPVYVLISEKVGVPLMVIEKYVKYVSRATTIVHAGTSNAHSLSIAN